MLTVEVLPQAVVHLREAEPAEMSTRGASPPKDYYTDQSCLLVEDSPSAQRPSTGGQVPYFRRINGGVPVAQQQASTNPMGNGAMWSQYRVNQQQPTSNQNMLHHRYFYHWQYLGRVPHDQLLQNYRQQSQHFQNNVQHQNYVLMVNYPGVAGQAQYNLQGNGYIPSERPPSQAYRAQALANVPNTPTSTPRTANGYPASRYPSVHLPPTYYQTGGQPMRASDNLRVAQNVATTPLATAPCLTQSPTENTSPAMIGRNTSTMSSQASRAQEANATAVTREDTCESLSYVSNTPTSSTRSAIATTTSPTSSFIHTNPPTSAPPSCALYNRTTANGATSGSSGESSTSFQDENPSASRPALNSSSTTVESVGRPSSNGNLQSTAHDCRVEQTCYAATVSDRSSTSTTTNPNSQEDTGSSSDEVFSSEVHAHLSDQISELESMCNGDSDIKTICESLRKKMTDLLRDQMPLPQGTKLKSTMREIRKILEQLKTSEDDLRTCTIKSWLKHIEDKVSPSNTKYLPKGNTEAPKANSRRQGEGENTPKNNFKEVKDDDGVDDKQGCRETKPKQINKTDLGQGSAKNDDMCTHEPHSRSKQPSKDRQASMSEGNDEELSLHLTNISCLTASFHLRTFASSKTHTFSVYKGREEEGKSKAVGSSGKNRVWLLFHGAQNHGIATSIMREIVFRRNKNNLLGNIDIEFSNQSKVSQLCHLVETFDQFLPQLSALTPSPFLVEESGLKSHIDEYERRYCRSLCNIEELESRLSDGSSLRSLFYGQDRNVEGLLHFQKTIKVVFTNGMGKEIPYLLIVFNRIVLFFPFSKTVTTDNSKELLLAEELSNVIFGYQDRLLMGLRNDSGLLKIVLRLPRSPSPLDICLSAKLLEWRDLLDSRSKKNISTHIWNSECLAVSRGNALSHLRKMLPSRVTENVSNVDYPFKARRRLRCLAEAKIQLNKKTCIDVSVAYFKPFDKEESNEHMFGNQSEAEKRMRSTDILLCSKKHNAFSHLCAIQSLLSFDVCLSDKSSCSLSLPVGDGQPVGGMTCFVMNESDGATRSAAFASIRENASSTLILSNLYTFYEMFAKKEACVPLPQVEPSWKCRVGDMTWQELVQELNLKPGTEKGYKERKAYESGSNVSRKRDRINADVSGKAKASVPKTAMTRTSPSSLLAKDPLISVAPLTPIAVATSTIAGGAQATSTPRTFVATTSTPVALVTSTAPSPLAKRTTVTTSNAPPTPIAATITPVSTGTTIPKTTFPNSSASNIPPFSASTTINSVGSTPTAVVENPAPLDNASLSNCSSNKGTATSATATSSRVLKTATTTTTTTTTTKTTPSTTSLNTSAISPVPPLPNTHSFTTACNTTSVESSPTGRVKIASAMENFQFRKEIGNHAILQHLNCEGGNSFTNKDIAEARRIQRRKSLDELNSEEKKNDNLKEAASVGFGSGKRKSRLASLSLVKSRSKKNAVDSNSRQQLQLPGNLEQGGESSSKSGSPSLVSPDQHLMQCESRQDGLDHEDEGRLQEQRLVSEDLGAHPCADGEDRATTSNLSKPIILLGSIKSFSSLTNVQVSENEERTLQELRDERYEDERSEMDLTIVEVKQEDLSISDVSSSERQAVHAVYSNRHPSSEGQGVSNVTFSSLVKYARNVLTNASTCQVEILSKEKKLANSFLTKDHDVGKQSANIKLGVPNIAWPSDMKNFKISNELATQLTSSTLPLRKDANIRKKNLRRNITLDEGNLMFLPPLKRFKPDKKSPKSHQCASVEDVFKVSSLKRKAT